MKEDREIEVKILDIDIEEFKQKLKEINANFVGETLQKYYVYDFESIWSLYMTIVNNLNSNLGIDNNLKKLNKLFYDLDNLLLKDDKKEINNLIGKNSLYDWIRGIKTIDENTLNVLNNENLMRIVKKYNSYPNKWIRLRQTGPKTTITVKQIYDATNTNGIEEHKIDSVREIEMEVDTIENGKKILEELGYYFKAYQEKVRISYTFEDISIDIDLWPKIPPYVEIEAKTEEDVLKVVKMLGYSNEDVVTMNTWDVYLRYGIDLSKIKELVFEKSS